MTTQYNEQALESLIEKHLTGYTVEELKDKSLAVDSFYESDEHYLSGKGYYIGSALEFDKRYALYTKLFWDFLEKTQAKELAKLQVSSDWKLKILERFDRKVRRMVSLSF